MSRKKKNRKPQSKKPVQRREARHEEPVPDAFEMETLLDAIGLPDARSIEIEMRRQLGHLLGPQDPQAEAAQDLLMDAFDEPDRERRIQLAQKALAEYPDCADAYLLLSEEAETWDEALQLCEEAVEAGQRAVGEEFEETVGHFWGVLETRPYMRARLALGQCLWAGGRRQEAMEHYVEMLRLNPDDNQGVRYLAASGLLEEGRLQDLDRLLDQYDEDSTTWNYTKAVCVFRREGDTENARSQLHAAIAANPYVPGFLVDSELLPSHTSDYVTPGEEDEAVGYVGNFVAGWKATPGAIAWLRKTTHGLSAPKKSVPSNIREGDAWDLLELPQDLDEVWQCDVLRMPNTSQKGDKKKSAWAVLISNVTDDEVQHADFLQERPKPSEAWQVLMDAMLSPDGNEPRRPGRIEVRKKTLWRPWRSKLQVFGIECDCVDDLEHLDRVMSLVQQRYLASSLRTDRPEDIKQILALPLANDDFWQVGVSALPTWLNDEGEMRQPWMVLVVNGGNGCVLHQSIETEEPSSEAIVRTVFQAMLAPVEGEPRRPRVVQVRTGDHRIVLMPHLESVGVECFAASSLEALDDALESLDQFMGGEQLQPALIDIPGINLRQVERFFEAAATFYVAAPWRRVMSDAVIRMEFGMEASDPWFAVVIGQAGMSLGLAVYQDIDVLEALLNGETDEEEFAEQMAGMSVNFGERFEIAFADLEAAEQFGWRVVAPEAYPYVYCVAPGYEISAPTLSEVERLTACLETVPKFISSGQKEMICQVELADSQMPVRLDWVDDR